MVEGKCLLMCPETERNLRELQRRLHPFEIAKGTESTNRPVADPEKTVKEYSRPAAGKSGVVPNDLRPSRVLFKTWLYLVDKILDRTDVHYLTIYNFVFDRLRSIRQDAVIQRIENPEIVTILEQAVRFHVVSSYRLCEESQLNFDNKICSDHLNECLSRLLSFYHFYPEFCQNQVEFQTLYMLNNLGSTKAAMHILDLPPDIRNHCRIQHALRLNKSYVDNNFIRFIRLSEQCNYIESCALEKYRIEFLISSLTTMNVAYHSKSLMFPSCILSEWLAFDTTLQAVDFCHECGLAVKDGSVSFVKGSMKDKSQMKHKRKLSQKMVDYKLNSRTLSQIIKGLDDGINEPK